MADKQPKTATEQLAKQRSWPKGIPMPKAGAYSSHSRWTYDEEELLRKYYPQYGTAYCMRLLGRSEPAIMKRAGRLMLQRSNATPELNTEQQQYILQNVGKLSFNAIGARLGIGAWRVSAFAKRNGVNLHGRLVNQWTEEETKFLREHYSTMRISAIAKHIGRSHEAVYQFVDELGLPHETSYYAKTFRWLPREDALIRKLYGKKSRREIAAQLGRSLMAVKSRIDVLGLAEKLVAQEAKWSRIENALLRELYPSHSLQKIARRIGRPLTSVRLRAAKLKLDKAQRTPDTPWTTSEDAKLRQLYPKYNNREIGRRLGRSLGAVQHRARALGLRKPETTVGSRWTKQEETALRTMFPTMTSIQIAHRLNRSIYGVRRRLHSMGLKRYSRTKK